MEKQYLEKSEAGSRRAEGKIWIREVGSWKLEVSYWRGMASRVHLLSWMLLVVLSILQFPTSIIQAQTLDDHLLTATENNPEIQAYFSDYLAALERIPQAGTLPDPELSLGLFVRPMERFMGNQHADLQLMQMFPWFGSLGIRKDEASKMARARYEAFRMVKNELLFQVKVAWYELSRLNEEIKISKAHLNILEKYERLALVRYQSSNREMNRSNASSNQGMEDVLRIRMEMNELENTISLLEDTQEALVAEFNALLNRNPEETLAIPDKLPDEPLPMNRLELLDSIKTFNPRLRMLDAEGAAYASQKKMAELEGRPMMGAGVNYMAFSPRTENGMNMGGNNMVMPMFKITLPIYRKKFKSMEKAAALNQQASLQRMENTVNQLSTQWRNALRDWDDANRRVDLYQKQTKLAQQTLDLLMTAYASDGKAFEDLLKVQQQLLDYQLKRIMAIVDKNNSLAQLENLAGI
ncbi:TolC family protein [Cyclobacterium plantarum]|uniref:TolC family protein n=1 Tax=Cyclobacterium plantarum TaxID=2716263 RepID=A0ABX0H5M5_9BACT|nr:TolC family protein [Cyclobacterium plantarum]NHE57141.1 TolC family protein [Cyclobacterium plantarum]